MTTNIIECEEFSEVSVRLAALMHEGELQIDPRIAERGYLSASFKRGQVILRTTKFVGLIPLTTKVSVRIVPRASISNLSIMLARSQKAPTAIAGFSRGYNSKFIRASNVEKVFGRSLAEQSLPLGKRGLIKRYERPANRVPWRGRFLASETVRRHAAKGVRYRHEFDQTVLTDWTIDNFAIKEALRLIVDWYRRNDRRSDVLGEAMRAFAIFDSIPAWSSSQQDLMAALGRLLSGQAAVRHDYAGALWSAYAVLGGSIPDLDESGKHKLDSLIIDVSEVFEAYLRRELSEGLRNEGYKIYDGWKRPHPFFSDGGRYSVHPDMIIHRDGVAVAILDAKYKPEISEQDRYEVLSFLDVMGLTVGGFVTPATGNERSRFMGTTSSGKRLHNLRVDLASSDPQAEVATYVENVRRMLLGRQDFL